MCSVPQKSGHCVFVCHQPFFLFLLLYVFFGGSRGGIVPTWFKVFNLILSDFTHVLGEAGCLSHFSTAMTKCSDQSYLREKGLFWLTVPEGQNPPRQTDNQNEPQQPSCPKPKAKLGCTTNYFSNLCVYGSEREKRKRN